MSPELETLDQLLGGDLPIAVIRGLFDDDSHFAHAVEAMLCEMEIRLLTRYRSGNGETFSSLSQRKWENAGLRR